MKVGDLVQLTPEGKHCGMKDFIGIILHVYKLHYYDILIENNVRIIGEHWLEKIQ